LKVAAEDRPRVGLALGGGFARGIAHIGVLKELERQHVPIDYIAGTSVGALIGAAYAAGVPLAILEKLAGETSFQDFGKWTLSWLGLASNERIPSYLRRVTHVERFEDLRIPLAVAATDLRSGETVHFTRGELGPALRASCAYPGLFLPVEHDGRVLVDGFLTAPVPARAVRRMGADVVIGVYLESAGLEGKPKNVAEIVGRSFSIMQDRSAKEWRKAADVILEPDVKAFQWDDFSQTPKLIHAGEAAARRAMHAIQSSLWVGRRAPQFATPATES
jgi:NTE family protein